MEESFFFLKSQKSSSALDKFYLLYATRQFIIFPHKPATCSSNELVKSSSRPPFQYYSPITLKPSKFSPLWVSQTKYMCHISHSYHPSWWQDIQILNKLFYLRATIITFLKGTDSSRLDNTKIFSYYNSRKLSHTNYARPKIL